MLAAMLACGPGAPFAELRRMDARLQAQVARLAEAERDLDLRVDEPARPPVDSAGAEPWMALRALALLDEHYVIEPDWSAMAAAGDAAVGALVDGKPPPVNPGTALAAGARLKAWTSLAPSPQVVTTWTDAALAALDTHTRMIWPSQVGGWEEHHAGVYVGVGLELGFTDAVRVRWPIPDGPAWEAGLQQGDRLLAIDDQPVTSVDQAARALRGEEGTTVQVTVDRRGAELGFTVPRRSIVPPTVVGWTRGPDNRFDPWLDQDAGIAYLRVISFRRHTDEALDQLIEPLLGQIRAVVLDLRGCPGGDLDAAAQVADRFVARGTLVHLEGRRLPPPPPPGVVAWNDALEGHPLEGLPVAVLIDGQTASSAEIVAGALDQLADALLIGAPTYGKASSQRLIPLDGFALQLTNLRWKLPNGQLLDGVGVHPDELLPLGLAGTYQIDLMRRRREHARTHADGSPILPDLPSPRPDLPVLDDDPHVIRALLRLRERLGGP